MLSARERNLLWGANLWYFGEGMFGPLFAVYAQKVGGSVLDITTAWAIFLAVTGVCTIFVGRIADRYTKNLGREKILTAGYALNALFTFGYLFVSTPQELFLVQAGLGVAASLSIPTWLSLFASSTKEHKASGWGLESGMSNFVHALAIVIGGYIVTRYSFEALFVMMGVIQVVAAIYQARILKLR